MRWLVCAIVVVVGVVPARADETATAEAAFERAQELVKKGDYAGACPLFDASFRADAALGTLLNLADCHAHVGKTATAWAEFRDALARATKRAEVETDPGEQAKDRQRAQFATDQIAALEPRLTRVRIAKPPAGVTVTLDGADVTPLAGTDMPVDPGDHDLAASAPGRVTWTEKLPVQAAAGTTPIDIPALAEAIAKPAGGEGTLTIVAARPDAEISIDGKPLAVGRYTGAFGVGGHTLRVAAPGTRVYQTEVYVGDGTSRTIEVPLEAEASAAPPVPPFRPHVLLAAYAGSGVATAKQTTGLGGARTAKVSGEPIVAAVGLRYALLPWLDAQTRLGFAYVPEAAPTVFENAAGGGTCPGTTTGVTSVTYVDLEGTLRARPSSGPWYLGAGLALGLQKFGGTGAGMFTSCGSTPSSITVDTSSDVLIGAVVGETGFVFGPRDRWELGVSARLGVFLGTTSIQALDQVRLVVALGYAFY